MERRLVLDRDTGRVYVYVNGKLTSLKLWIAQPHDLMIFMGGGGIGEQRFVELQRDGEVRYTA